MQEKPPGFVDPVEDFPWLPPRAILARLGYQLTPPTQLDDRQLPGRLWEFFYAAAARRFFFHFTNHLDDRALYTLIWDKWLDEPTPDIPPEAETNTTIFISEFDAGGLTSEEIWLRYYADAVERENLHPGNSDCSASPNNAPPHDRDRFLPTPPIPLEAHAGWLPGDDVPENEPSEPLGIDEVDEEIAAANIESVEDSPPFKIEEQLRAAEPANWTSPASQLAEQNIPLLPPAEITNETLVPILWELMHNLSLRGFYGLHTDHLSDRELYDELWERGLRDPAHLPGRNPRGGWYHDFLGSWGEDEMQLWLRYYANDEERAKHATEWPEDKIPEKEKPQCNRDWRMPKGPF